VLFVYNLEREITNPENSIPNFVSFTKTAPESEDKIIYMFYDSNGNISGISAQTAEYMVRYNEKSVRYIIQNKISRALLIIRDIQYDENKLIVGEIFTAKKGKEESRNEERTYIEYSYKFDRYGNWTERTAISRTQKLGVLIPTQTKIIKREIVY
jgi:hypothetical protein